MNACENRKNVRPLCLEFFLHVCGLYSPGFFNFAAFSFRNYIFFCEFLSFFLIPFSASENAKYERSTAHQSLSTCV